MFIIYTKSNCCLCNTIKKLLEKEKCIIINCDEMLESNDREAFINEMKRRTKWNKITFPMIFIDDDFLGGYNDFIANMAFDYEMIDKHFYF